MIRVRVHMFYDHPSGVAVLENMPVAQRDWQPGADRQVLDLVDPALYPIINNVSRVLPSADRYHSPCADSSSSSPPFNSWRDELNGGYIACFRLGSHSDFGVSRKYQFLPSEFAVSADGAVSIRSYINNLHPTDHAPLYATIASVFERLVPLFARTLTDLLHPRPKRVHFHGYSWNYAEHDPESDDDFAHLSDWVDPPKPEVGPFKPPPAHELVDLRGRNLQACLHCILHHIPISISLLFSLCFCFLLLLFPLLSLSISISLSLSGSFSISLSLFLSISLSQRAYLLFPTVWLRGGE